MQGYQAFINSLSQTEELINSWVTYLRSHSLNMAKDAFTVLLHEIIFGHATRAHMTAQIHFLSGILVNIYFWFDTACMG